MPRHITKFWNIRDGKISRAPRERKIFHTQRIGSQYHIRLLNSNTAETKQTDTPKFPKEDDFQSVVLCTGDWPRRRAGILRHAGMQEGDRGHVLPRHRRQRASKGDRNETLTPERGRGDDFRTAPPAQFWHIPSQRPN